MKTTPFPHSHRMPLGMFLSALLPSGLMAAVYYQNDFELETPGQRPAGALYSFSPNPNTATNGFQILDATTSPANVLNGKSLYVYDLSDSAPTHLRWDFNNGQEISAARVEFTFQRAYATALDDSNTRVHMTVARAGTGTNSSANRAFEVRFYNNGNLLINSAAGNTPLLPYATSGANRFTLFINSHDSAAIAYDDPVLGQGSVEPNSFQVYLNDTSLGQFGFILTTSGGLNFGADDTDLGRIAFYQDTSRQGGIIFDDLLIQDIESTAPPPIAPSDLQATATAPTTISLSWTDRSSDETAFQVWRKVAGQPTFTLLASLPPDTVGFEDVDLQPATTYTYYLQATNGKLSDPSPEVTATTPPQLAPRILTLSSDQLLLAGDQTTLEVTYDGEEPMALQWYAGLSGDRSQPLAEAVAATYLTPPLVVATNYWVLLSNQHGETESPSIALAIRTAREFLVSNQSEWQAASAQVLPGDSVVVQNGTYLDWVMRCTGKGTERYPIIYRAESPGRVILRGASRLEIGGEWLTARGFVFQGPYSGNDDEIIQFRSGGVTARNGRLTECAIFDAVSTSGAKTFWVSLRGERNRVDHNYFKGHDQIGVTLVVWLEGKANYHLVEYNHFDRRLSGGGANEWETIRIGDSDTSMTTSSTTVRHNLFSYLDGEIETISNKSGDNRYLYNTFLANQGTLTLRHGNACRVEGNFFLGLQRTQTGGVRIIGEDHVVVNNYFEGLTARDGAQVTVYAGVPNSPLNEYFAAHRALIAHNTFVDNNGPAVEIGAGFGSRDRSVLPTGITVANNLFYEPQAGESVVVGANPAAQTWTGNLAFGGSVSDSVAAGFVIADPLLSREGWWRLTEASPARDAGVAVPAVILDIEGRPRDSSPDLGAEEWGPLPEPANHPLTNAETGPDWLNTQRQFWTVWPTDHFPDALRSDRDTYEIPWLGAIFVPAYPWVFHQQHGWWFIAGPGPEVIFLHDPQLAWLYTGPSVYPFLYDFGRNRWLYYYPGSANPRYFYDFVEKIWFTLES